MNKEEEKLINIYNTEEYKEAIRKKLFGLLSFKKEEQFHAYVDVLMVILKNHIKETIKEMEENYISKAEVKEKIKELPRYTFFTDEREFTTADVISRKKVIELIENKINKRI